MEVKYKTLRKEAGLELHMEPCIPPFSLGPHGGQIQNLEERGGALGSARNSPLMHHWTRHLQTMELPGRIKNCDFFFFSFCFVFVCGGLTFDSCGFFGHEQRKCLKGPTQFAVVTACEY